MQQPNRRYRPAASLAGCALGLALLATPLHARKIERGLEPAHQPVVERTDFVFDVASSGDGSLDAAEHQRLSAWFDALDLRYGDHVTIAGPEGYGMAGLRDAIKDVVARYGLLTEGEAPVTVGMPAAGSLRVVVSRAKATVPGCPSWRDRTEADFTGGLSDNYGCAVESNLAAMVADPRDLVEGHATTTDLRTATSDRAIQSYMDQKPTGAGGLQVMSAGGK